MQALVKQATGTGQLDIAGEKSPVSYVVTSNSDGVDVEVSLPRDWLLKRGFQKEAILIRQSGQEVTVMLDKTLTIADPVSVILSAHDVVSGSTDLKAQFPEFQ